jgi:hypothetical protein
MMQQEREAEAMRGKKQRCVSSENGGCFCTGRCHYTKEEWERLEEIKSRVKFTGVNEMKFPIGD